MNTLKKSTIILIFLIGTLSFSKKDNEVYNFGLNLKDINVEKILLDSQSECRPSSELTFYVENDRRCEYAPLVITEVTLQPYIDKCHKMKLLTHSGHMGVSD